MNKSIRLTSFILGLSALLLFTTESQAQLFGKKKKQIEQLTKENGELRKAKRQIEERATELEGENQRVSAQLSSMRTEVARLETENASLREQLNGMGSELESLKSEKAERESYAPAPNDSRSCAKRQGKLQMNKSYFVDLSSQVISKGWGLQVYSSRNLCQAQEAAEEFQSYYHLYKTYIKIKNEGGEPLYCVIYASLKYKDQAKVYCNNFRKIGRTEGEQNAFLVQHQ